MVYNTAMIASDDTVRQAAEHLAAHDPHLAPIIAQAGPTTLRPHNNYYAALVGAIISQQLSVKAADTIERRFIALFGGTELPPPEAILTKNIDELRSAGLSRGKATYVRDLAQHVMDGNIDFAQLNDLSNDAVVQELTTVKGIGEWTAHMFMMFSMGRLDVLATGDLGIRNGVGKLYGLGHSATPDEVVAIAKKYHWQPYESAACWYIWHSLDNKPAV